jgi:hypothetical protein
MIYFENASRGEEGLNTHLMSYTLCVSLSNFLERDFYFDYEIPCSTPPAYASKKEFKDRFKILLASERSLITDLIDIPARRIFEIDRQTENKAAYQLLYSHFVTTEELKKKFAGSIVWDSFGVGRFAQTREDLQGFDLIEWTHTKLSNPNTFYFLEKNEKRELLKSVETIYLDEIENLAAGIINQCGRYNAVHLRLGDFLTNYEQDQYAVEPESFRKYIEANFEEKDIPLLIATDGLDEKELFADLLKNFRPVFIDDLIFDEFRREYAELPFTDFNVLSILNQLLCAAGELFIGTYRSTFTGIIHRLRQERYGKRDFNFFPDGKVSKLLSEDYKITADRSGFFDWNRYSVFTEDHQSMAWMREWDFERSVLGG